MGKQLRKTFFFTFLFGIGWGANLFSQTNAWINEIHYDNNGGDTNEAIEIVIENPGMLSDYEVHLYNGSNGEEYITSETIDNFTVGATAGNFTFYIWTPSSFQNGPDGIALSYQGNTIQFLSYEGTITATAGPANGETSIDIGVVESNSTPIGASLQLIGTGGQYSDFTWQASAANTFGAVNAGQTLGGVTGNTPSSITNIVQTPGHYNVTPSDAVSVAADVVDVDGITSVELNWGTASGNLPNTILMNLTSGNTYSTIGSIPAQTNGTTIFYEIVVVDAHAVPATKTSSERSYTSQVPIFGWQITATDTPFTIDFEASVNNVNKDQFAAAGFHPNPVSGQLDSDAWSIHGLSDGDLNFGASGTTGDYAQGTSLGGVGNGGIYAFNTGSSGVSLGVQPVGSGFEPGVIILKFQNKTSSAITSLKIKYDIFSYNDQNYSSSFNFAHSADNSTIISVPSADFSSVETASASPTWIQNQKSVYLTGLSIAPDGFYYLRWKSEVISGAGSRDEFGLDNITLIANPTTGTNYVYNNGWTPSDPNGTATILDNITVQSGLANFNQDIAMNNLTVQTGATLNVEQILAVNGNIVNNGDLIFINNGNKLGQLAEMASGSTISGSGSVTVQRYVPGGTRAFRFISPSVTTTTSIHANWQEGATARTDDPNPGFGTHISGTLTATDQTNGFDGTTTGNPSLFLFNNSTQSWGAISNTDVNVLSAGKAYRLFVRGSRAVDLDNNNSPPDATTLRATGSLVVGNHTDSNMGTIAGDFNFIGNPYQSIVNINDVLANSTNLNPKHYYVWDPNMNTRGGYVTVALPTGTNTIGSEADQFLQPGQAAFVTTLANGSTSILFEETDKAPYQNPTAVFRGMPDNTSATITLQLYEAQAFDNDGSVADGVLIKFDANESNAVLPNDAAKKGNIDENLAVVNAAHYLSIEHRALPIDGENIPLFSNQYRHNNYTYKADLDGFAENITVYLKDNYLQTTTELANNSSTVIDFTIDENNQASTATDRFSFVFDVDNLSVEKEMANIFKVYPNPTNNGIFYIETNGMAGKTVKVSLFNLLGQKVFSAHKKVGANQQIEMKTLGMNTGIYWVKITHQEKIFTEKIIFQ